jgi:hypothetical protein
MTKKSLSPEFTAGLLAGIFLYIGFRSIAAVAEEYYYGAHSVLALSSALTNSLLLPLGIGLALRSSACLIVTKVYAWMFVIGNSILIPLYFTSIIPTAMKTAASVATWFTMIFVLLLAHRRDVVAYFEAASRPK